MASQIYSYLTTSTSPPVTAMDAMILCDATSAAFTHTLPDATKCRGLTATVYKKDSTVNAVTIGTTSSQNILAVGGNVTTIALAAQGNSRTVKSDGVQWYVVAST